jgi:hypothetical protein
MDSDFALVAGFSQNAGAISSLASIDDLPVDYGILFDARTDPEAAARTVEGLTTAMDGIIDLSSDDLDLVQVSITRTDEVIDGADVVVYTIEDETGFNLLFPVEVLVGSDDEVFAVGSRHVVETAIRGDGTLQESIAYVEASEDYLIEESGTLLLVNVEALSPIPSLYLALNSFDPNAESDAQLMRDILGFFSSATTSGVNAETGVSTNRATISLNRPE